MSKICGQCNLTVDDNVAFCPGCGAQLPVAATTPVQPAQAANANAQIVNTEAAKAKMNEVAGKAQVKGKEFLSKLKSDKKTQFTVGGIVVAVIVVIILLNIVFPSSTAVVKGYMKATQNMDAKKVASYYNKDYIKYVEDNFSKYVDYDTFEEMLEQTFEYEEDKDYKIVSYEIDKDYKTYSKSKTEDIADELEDDYDIDAKSVKKVRKYSVKIKSETDGDKDTDKESIYVVKIGLKWYIFSGIDD